ncbi:dTDP-4-dehydrorhamnose 3,5-epimerase family protein [Streptomyces sp. G44]|uniref:dTDP-4-dehydrorhamnose 3,5-epimerase family protein n=1 Tax=Streptomyces sp. G44 TaxID=2807632 RepID=UPI0019620F73|nr:dTDP-4-dehydrorhamnose 3,5-epimerase family protein [Streptomyces sp. G44]MBM7167513.1 dTDP-4-dehydrorhamnose 3,5-epimerase family protein [Streptomyces sp. G44]
MKQLSIEGVWLHEPRAYPDSRGVFHEWFRSSSFESGAGFDFPIAQANCTFSHQGTLRGIHFAAAPGQAKYVTCVRGAVLDVAVDLRLGSATFGSWEAVRLDDENRHTVYLAADIGHGFMALTEGAVVVYLCSSEYKGSLSRSIHPLDPDLAIGWPLEPVLSEQDASAPSLAQARARGLLPP